MTGTAATTMEIDSTTFASPVFDARLRRTAADVLWAAAQVPGPDAVTMQRALAAGPHLGFTVEVALSQRLGPMLWRAMGAADAADRLGPAADPDRTDYLVRRAQAELLIPRAMTLAIDALRTAGIDPLLFKGPSVAARYPEPGLRPMDDIDLLVPPEDASRAAAALNAAGWRLVSRPGEHYDAAFVHPEAPHLPVELHRALSAPKDDGTRLTLPRLWAARRPATVLGVPTLVLPPEEDLIALAAHAAKPFHNFSRLIWAVDLAVVVTDAGAGLDWDRLLALARTVRCRTAVAMGLRLATRLGASVAAAVPPAALEIPAGVLRRRALAPVLDRSWPTARPDDDLRSSLRFAMWEDPVRRAYLHWADATAPGLRYGPGRLWATFRHRRPPLPGGALPGGALPGGALPEPGDPEPGDPRPPSAAPPGGDRAR